VPTKTTKEKARPRSAGTKWLTKIRKQYPIPASDPLADTLRLAVEALDRAEAAEDSIQADGVLIPGLHGKKQNPAVAIKRDAVQEFTRLCRLLGLHDEEGS
jgi:Phage terminase, small subunit